MTIVLPHHYHARQALEETHILCVAREDALREDIRALRIGILNVMPKAETYEFSLLHPLGRSIMQIDPVWLRLKSHHYSSSDQEHIASLYVTFEEAIRDQNLDGLVLTGAPVEEIPFEEVTYWEEIKQILKYAQNNIASTLGICWGGLALAMYLGIDKEMSPQKIFGVFKAKNLNHEHRITGDLDDEFWCPQSRHATISDSVLELERDKGNIQLLAHSKDVGYFIFESTDHRFLMHLGHPEYEPNRLVEEYWRDVHKGRTDVNAPVYVNLDNPVNLWRSHRNEFFAQWIKFVHETSSSHL